MFEQLLPTSTTTNVWRLVRRIIDTGHLRVKHKVVLISSCNLVPRKGKSTGNEFEETDRVGRDHS